MSYCKVRRRAVPHVIARLFPSNAQSGAPLGLPGLNEIGGLPGSPQKCLEILPDLIKPISRQSPSCSCLSSRLQDLKKIPILLQSRTRCSEIVSIVPEKGDARRALPICEAQTYELPVFGLKIRQERVFRNLKAPWFDLRHARVRQP